MRIAVTGAAGGLGRAFCSIVPQHHDMTAFDHDALDLADHHAVMGAITSLRPDVVFNFAAFTNVDACESDPDRAFRVNALGPQSLALAARASEAVLVHVSTDYVFDGEKGAPYDELDAPNPLSVYARSKLAGEEFVRRLAPEHFVVRTGQLFGPDHGYISTAIRRLAAGEEVGGIVGRIGTPTFVGHLAERLIPLWLTGRFGTYHLAGPEPTSWYDVLDRAKRLGKLPGRIAVQHPQDLGMPAPRPKYSALVSVFAERIGLPPMPPLDDALRTLLVARGAAEAAEA